MGSSGAAGFDRYWRSLGRRSLRPHTRLYSLSGTGTGRAPAGTTKPFPTAQLGGARTEEDEGAPGRQQRDAHLPSPIHQERERETLHC
jgi:hypothetical protein